METKAELRKKIELLKDYLRDYKQLNRHNLDAISGLNNKVEKLKEDLEISNSLIEGAEIMSTKLFNKQLLEIKELKAELTNQCNANRKHKETIKELRDDLIKHKIGICEESKKAREFQEDRPDHFTSDWVHLEFEPVTYTAKKIKTNIEISDTFKAIFKACRDIDAKTNPNAWSCGDSPEWEKEAKKDASVTFGLTNDEVQKLLRTHEFKMYDLLDLWVGDVVEFKYKNIIRRFKIETVASSICGGHTLGLKAL